MIACDVTPAQFSENGLLASACQAVNGEATVMAVNLSSEEAHCDLGSKIMARTYTTSDSSILGKSDQLSSHRSIPVRAVTTVCFEAL